MERCTLASNMFTWPKPVGRYESFDIPHNEVVVAFLRVFSFWRTHVNSPLTSSSLVASDTDSREKRKKEKEKVIH